MPERDWVVSNSASAVSLPTIYFRSYTTNVLLHTSTLPDALANGGLWDFKKRWYIIRHIDCRVCCCDTRHVALMGAVGTKLAESSL
ncbi:hypothetical protein Vi05172_g6445 [Venturia inaequalis]|nr:hypothetical protein Vi05172_g6445 [Venturia inaequalis]